MLAVAYVLMLDDLAREVSALNMAAHIAAAFGAETYPVDWDAAKEAFDRDISTPPGVSGPGDRSSHGIKLRVLGVG